MAEEQKYTADMDVILSHRHDNGGDLWATPDKRLLKGAPYTTLESPLYLLELGMDPGEQILKDTAELIFSVWQKDGRFRVFPTGGIYPCQTAEAARTLCHLGYARDRRLAVTCRHLLDTQYRDGGWRCNKFSFGRGPETEFSNPGTALTALDLFRFTEYLNTEPALDRAVESLLDHWTVKKPIGPCHYGIGTLFMQAEYPFRGYNLFHYVHVLSFYDRAKKDPRFLEALHALDAKLVDGQIVVERVVPKLAELNFCKKGKPSALAAKRYMEIVENLRADEG